MDRQISALVRLVGGVSLLFISAQHAHAIRGYGVDANFTLFDFDVDSSNPDPVHVDGNIGFLPEGIDFRPSSNVLYAIDVNSNLSQLYTIDIGTGVKTAVGAGFPSSVPGSYTITPSSRYGFDFDPTSLAVDGSMEIRLINTSGTNMRINSKTGLVAGVDTNLVIPPSNAPFADGIAYTNNFARTGGATTLFDLDTRNESLFTQNPSTGALTLVGAFGTTINAVVPTSFDIYTALGDADPSIGGDRGLAVFRRPDAPELGGPVPQGSYLLYDVNLATGATLNGRAVGVPATPANFDGGFSVLPAVPEPATIALARWLQLV